MISIEDDSCLRHHGDPCPRCGHCIDCGRCVCDDGDLYPNANVFGGGYHYKEQPVTTAKETMPMRRTLWLICGEIAIVFLWLTLWAVAKQYGWRHTLEAFFWLVAIVVGTVWNLTRGGRR